MEILFSHLVNTKYVISKMSESKRKIICPECGAENVSWRRLCHSCGIPLQEDEDIYAVTFHRWGKKEWVALILGLIGAGILTWMIVAFSSRDLFFIVLVILPWAGLTIAWKWPSVSSALLIVTVILFFISVFIPVFPWATNLGQAFTVLFLAPFIVITLLVSGILFIFSWMDWR